MSTDYNATSIKVLSDEEARGRFEWVKVDHLVRLYPQHTPEFIRRLVESTQLSGGGKELWERVERRYLKGDVTCDVQEDFKRIHLDLMLNSTRGFGMR